MAVTPAEKVFVGGHPLPDFPAFGVDNDAPPVKPQAVRMVLEITSHGLQAPFIVKIVRIQPGNDLAFGHMKSFVQGVGLSPVFFRYPADLVSVAFEDFQGPVGAASVHHNDFKTGVILSEDGVNGLCDKIALIKRGDNRGNQRECSGTDTRVICVFTKLTVHDPPLRNKILKAFCLDRQSDLTKLILMQSLWM